MVNRRSFKSDVSFLEKISMGATGTITVFNNLREQGHTPIELERGSRSFKIWKNIKIKWKGSIHRTPFHLTNKGSIHRTLF